jgi:hypothetical protein
MRHWATIAILLTSSSSAFGQVQTDLNEILADRTSRVEKAQVELEKQIALATRLAIAKLETLATSATRKGDPTGAQLAWKQVLTFDQANAKARRYFTTLGTLEQVLKTIGDSPPPTTGVPESGSNGSELIFDGTGSAIVSSLKYDGQTPVTMEAVVTASEVAGRGRSIVANIHSAGLGLMLEDGAWQMMCHDGKTYRRARSDKPAKIGERIHFAGVYDGRMVRVYINGILQKAVEQMSGPHKPSLQPFLIGEDPTSTGRPEHPFQGTIHSVRISNVARYNRNFAVPKGFGADKSTVALWKMDEGEGQILKDSSGNGHHARINGAKWISKTK